MTAAPFLPNMLTDLPPEAAYWGSMEEAGKAIDAAFPDHFGPGRANARKLIFEIFNDDWICEVHELGLHVGWIRKFVVRFGGPRFLAKDGGFL